ncbi:rhox homeobox family member 2 [Phodopus roborovskii]|uniref:Gm9 protein n=1 Tax=Phodopus roborovskii TaxID=109678 RepID=A0AAU9YZD0_PHORO|nr:rhox homeobox family member 2 [Phodopus roborovskii]CAH6779930.1 Gm9 [Phodopus roborovskii]
MDHPRKFEHEDSNYQTLRVDASLEEAKAKPPVINIRGGGDGGDQIWSKLDLGVAAGESSDFGFLGVGVPGTKNDEDNKGYGGQDQDQPTLEASAGMPQLQDDNDLSEICSAFSGLQLRELERIFQRTQFPNVFVRKELGVPVNVEAEAEPGEPEDEVSE